MATDCETLSPNAKKIFEQLKPFFPPDPWQNPMWQENGIVINNDQFDLRKSADREKLINKNLKTLGTFVEITAGAYKKERKSLDGFEIAHFGLMIKTLVELLFVLRELDFQIETMDTVEA